MDLAPVIRLPVPEQSRRGPELTTGIVWKLNAGSAVVLGGLWLSQQSADSRVMGLALVAAGFGIILGWRLGAIFAAVGGAAAIAGRLGSEPGWPFVVAIDTGTLLAAFIHCAASRTSDRNAGSERQHPGSRLN